MMHREASDPLARTFIRRIFPGIALVLGLISLLGLTLLVLDAQEQDRHHYEDGAFMLDMALRQQMSRQAMLVADYAGWTEAYVNLHRERNSYWAYDLRNIGPEMYEEYSYEGVFVVAPDGRTVYSVIEGRLEPAVLAEWLDVPSDLDEMLMAARNLEGYRSLQGYHTVGGQLALVTAAAIQATSSMDSILIPGLPSILVFVDVLTPLELAGLGASIRLDDLQQSAERDPGSDWLVSLAGAGRDPLILRWSVARPGLALLRQVLPVFLAAAVLLAGLVYLLFRYAWTSARILDLSRERFRDIAESVSDWIWEVDEGCRITYLSGRFTALTGERIEHWLGHPLDVLLQTDEQSLVDWLHSPAAEQGSLTCRYRDRDGRPRICRLTMRRIRDAGPVSGFRGTARDVTEEVQAQAQIRHMARHDPLTGLANRNRLNDYLNRLLSPESPAREPCFALLCLDLDRFKPVNDVLGHGAGDRVLQEVACRLQAEVRETDLVARIGGDEFILVLFGRVDAGSIESVCERLVGQMARPFACSGQEVHIGTSIGVACYPRDSRDPEELVRFADLALYQAKATRGTWTFYAREMNERIQARHRLETELRQGIRDGQLHLFFQPRCRLVDLQVTGMEALTRWQHPQRGLLEPDQFIAMAEDSGLIVPLGQWVLREACRVAAGWAQPLRLSVNLSAAQFASSTLVDDVRQALQDSGLAGERLELEITETVMLKDAERARAVMIELKALGLRLSMDDFGTGFSSLGYLRSYPFDGVKIDRSFIAAMTASVRGRAVVQAIIGLGQSLGLAVTAEGVETELQLDILRQDACDEVQGFLMGRPRPVEELAELAGPGRRPAGDGESRA